MSNPYAAKAIRAIDKIIDKIDDETLSRAEASNALKRVRDRAEMWIAAIKPDITLGDVLDGRTHKKLPK